MTDFISKSLELLDQPAALFVHPTYEFVAANAAASRTASDLFDREVVMASKDDGRAYFELAGLDPDRMRQYVAEHGYYARESPVGTFFMTVLETALELTRPDLLLVSVHPDTSREDAYLAHHRMLSIVKTNEAGERSLRMMEDALLQMQAALSAQHAVLRETTHAAAEFFRLQGKNRRDGS